MRLAAIKATQSVKRVYWINTPSVSDQSTLRLILAEQTVCKTDDSSTYLLGIRFFGWLSLVAVKVDDVAVEVIEHFSLFLPFCQLLFKLLAHDIE